MIRVEEAKKVIHSNVPKIGTILKPLSEATGHFTSQDIFAPIDVPSYDQSSMDGYAIRYEDVASHPKLKVVGKMPAGAKVDVHCGVGEAVRIFTGAPLPSGADTIIMQEKIEVDGEFITIQAHDFVKGTNVRSRGSEIAQGEVGLAKGTRLSPAAIGFLASINIATTEVYRKPKVGLLITGDELIDVGNNAGFGEVYESNSHTVRSFLNSIGLNEVTAYRAKDNLDELVSTLKTVIAENDIILLTGGISVGEYDFVSQATKICGIQQVFHKVKQKPGKPLFFGKHGDKLVFGLPGNPTSVLTCLYQYVYLAIHALYGVEKELTTMQCQLTNSYKKPQGITHFLKGYYEANKVTILDGQESYKLKSYAITNCLIELGEEVDKLGEGEEVLLYLI
jgi:molybdopterin molybdotransferase